MAFLIKIHRPSAIGAFFFDQFDFLSATLLPSTHTSSFPIRLQNIPLQIIRRARHTSPYTLSNTAFRIARIALAQYSSRQAAFISGKSAGVCGRLFKSAFGHPQITGAVRRREVRA